ncbi:hypothetical protein J8273_1306 [Carpediemonas membranifera]|uniref:Uncharacterized protein n=1 Tax=Carpediemonas membranifera TaxID=201153 RepID=A0A8J6BAZ7_9EUKA|nr:hypothetical protein J8273_1306 [Carpediemonas membranifera]|eukprot:KAG9396959.1 hypothetical protein J8273_1306 [Carpediemonas membranifera]
MGLVSPNMNRKDIQRHIYNYQAGDANVLPPRSAHGIHVTRLRISQAGDDISFQISDRSTGNLIDLPIPAPRPAGHSLPGQDVRNNRGPRQRLTPEEIENLALHGQLSAEEILDLIFVGRGGLPPGMTDALIDSFDPDPADSFSALQREQQQSRRFRNMVAAHESGQSDGGRRRVA